MEKINLLNNSIPVSPALNPALEAENFKPSKEVNRKRLLIISIVALLNAALISLIAKFLMVVIYFIDNVCFFGTFSFSPSSPANNDVGLWVLIIPALGGLIVGIIALYGSQAIRGHGIPEAMEQILTNHSKIKPIITFLKPLSSAIAIGTGGPFGAEGPIIATGGALGSTIGQVLKISDHERKILLAAGATAGMAAIFGSPIAGMFLAVELLLFEFSPKSLIPVAVGCITGAAGHHLLFGTGPVFGMESEAIPSNLAVLIYSIIGILMGVVSVGASKAVYFIEEGFEKFPIHWMWWPAIGGLAVGIIGYFSPRTLGVGYENITDILAGHLALKVVISLCLLKFISWAIALGSGTSGGTLAPLMTIGGAAGALIGMGVLYVFPDSGITITMSALVGMAAMFAGASRALLTSIIFALETTSQVHALLPLLGSCVSSYVISFFFMENTIMTEKIAKRGVRTPYSYEPDILEQVTVEQVVNDFEVVINEEDSIQKVREWLSAEESSQANYFVVANKEGKFKGILSASELYSNQTIPENKVGSLVKYHHASARLLDTLRDTAEKMAQENVDVLPVVEGENIVGIISYHDLLNTFKQETDSNETKKAHISLKRNGFKILLRGQKLVSVIKLKR